MTTEIHRGRPRVGAASKGASPVVQARLDPELFAKFEAMRAAQGKSASDIVRDAIAALLEKSGPVPAIRRYAESRPVLLPKDLESLDGPTTGFVTLPTHIDWTPKKRYNLDNPEDLEDYYRVVIREASPSEMITFLDRDLLIKLWPTLQVDLRLVDKWEAAFPELRRR